VLLFDEIEKAHPDVFHILLQVLEDGRLTDGQGRLVDFRNTVVLLTSNIASREILEVRDPAERERLVQAALRETFRPEFLNRLDETVVFHPLDASQLDRIVGIQVERLAERLARGKRALAVSPEARRWLADKGTDLAWGARPLRRAIQRELENPLAKLILEGRIPEGATVKVEVRDDALDFAVPGVES
jgi:ATP-dependent Clp protease ATP-binding subunit ClpB